jgi:HD-GYP domain-containing protein (c-di-GMP phosphodiesterase class II)
MLFAIIIDRSLGKSVPTTLGRRAGSGPKHPVHVADDVVAAARQIRDERPAADRGLLVFLPARLLGRALPALKAVSRGRTLCRVVAVADGTKAGAALPGAAELLAGYRTSSLSEREFRFLVRESEAGFRRRFRKKKRDRLLALTLQDTDRDQEDLINIGRALSTEKNIDTLFRLILARAMKITGADAGTIYIVEKTQDGGKQIRVKYSHTVSRHIGFEEAVLPFSRETISGYVAMTGKVLNIPDVARLSARSPVSYNPRYDREHRYRTKSMLVVPMRNHADEIIGVIQLINSKENRLTADRLHREPDDILLTSDADYDRYVGPFAKRYDRLLEAVASQAAIAIENARMLKQIETQFDEFVKASVSAIESRDEATRGHSERVARMCARMAEAINRRADGPFKDVDFPAQRRRELNYAALLHDFGKVYLDARLLLKAKKLYPEDLEGLMQRIDIAFRQAEVRALCREVDLLRAGSASPEALAAAREIARERGESRAKLESARARIRALNEPTVSREDPRVVVDEVAALLDSFRCTDFDGRDLELMNERERSALLIPRGSLTPAEKRQIDSHVEHTYNFVSKIPWPKEWERIPEIARAHHELLDGSGYPRRLKGREAIPLEARMMCIADRFDALTASDRPYKKAVPVDKALLILKEEMKAGKLDPDLLALFEEERVWEDPPAAGRSQK